MKVLIVSDIISKTFLEEDFDADCQKVLDWIRDGRIEGYITEETLTIIREKRGGTEQEQEIFIENIKKKVPHVSHEIEALETENSLCYLREEGKEVGVACLHAREHQYAAVVTTNDIYYKSELSKISAHRVRVLRPDELLFELAPLYTILVRFLRSNNESLTNNITVSQLKVLLLVAIGSAIVVAVLAVVSEPLQTLLKKPKITASTVDKVCGLKIRFNTSNQSPDARRDKSKKKTEEGIAHYNKGDYNLAIESLCEALKLYRNNPEAVIYLNNSYLGFSPQIESYTIAALTPSVSNNLAAEVLRGVAQAQNEINGSPERIKGKGLKVIIDKDDPEDPVSTAQKIADEPDVIAVVGPYHSNSTIKALNDYKRNRLVFVSPTSTSEEFSRDCKSAHESGDGFCFRTVPSDGITTKKITDFLFEPPSEYRSSYGSLLPVAIFYSGKLRGKLENAPCSRASGQSDLYSYSMRESFCNGLLNRDKANFKRLVVKDFNLRASNFDAERAVNEALRAGAKTLVLFTGDDDMSFNNIKAIIRANQKEKKSILIGSDSLYRPELLTEEGKDLVGSPHPFLFVSPWIHPSSPNSAFLKSANELWTTFNVSWVTATSYDATRILASAFEKMPIQDRTKKEQARQAVQQALVNQQLTDAEGATGKVSFDRNNGNRNEETSQFVIVKPICLRNHAEPGYTFSQFNSGDSQDDRCQ